jgi:broad specificity phosphatase PhoE
MTRVALIRHGVTAENAAGRIQGRRDVPLSPAGRDALAGRRPPPDLDGFAWVSSPLLRARETAFLLTGAHATVDPRLTEMDWGTWEGETLRALRTRLGPAMAENEARGLDFTPPGGESPRMVAARVRPWLAETARGGGPVAAVTHKGVIRAIYAAATGWDMRGRPPDRLDWTCCHLFDLDGAGAPKVRLLNIPFADRAAVQPCGVPR